jgi:hypothetical protein
MRWQSSGRSRFLQQNEKQMIDFSITFKEENKEKREGPGRLDHACAKKSSNEIKEKKN